MKNIFKSFWADFKECNVSSFKKISKLLGVLITPILYAVTCVLAFWNPIVNISNATIGILDNDSNTGIVSLYKLTDNGGSDNESDKVYDTQTKIASSDSYEILSNDDYNSIYSQDAMTKFNDTTIYFSDETSQTLTYSDDSTMKEKAQKIFGSKGVVVKDGSGDSYLLAPNGYTTLAKMLINSNSILKLNKNNGDITKNVYELSIQAGDDKLDFKNIRYLNGQNASDAFKSNDYNIQLHFDKDFTVNTLTSLSKTLTSMNNMNVVSAISDFKSLVSSISGLTIYSSFSQSFLFGVFVDTIKNFDYGVLATLIDKIASGDIDDPLINTTISVLEQKLNIDIKTISAVLTLNTINVVKEADKSIATYGFGLGQMFVLIGLSASVIAMTFVLDRSKRVKKAKSYQWFLGKYLNMAVIGFVQVTILVLALTGVGWHILGPIKIIELWAWYLFLHMCIISAFCSLWFIFRSENMTRWCMIIYMLANIITGWGSFPTFMMPKFFDILSYITIFRWANLGSFHILYSDPGYWQSMLSYAGALLLIVCVFITIGMLLSKLRFRDVNFGSFKARKIILGLEEIGLTDLPFLTSKKEREIYLLNRKKTSLLNSIPLKNEIIYLENKIRFYEKLEDERIKTIRIEKVNKEIDLLKAKIENIDKELINKKVELIDKKISIVESKNKNGKQVYNWICLEDLATHNLKKLNIATNNNTEFNKTFSWFEEDVIFPNATDNELISRND